MNAYGTELREGHGRWRRWSRTAILGAALALAAVVASPGESAAQCAADCNRGCQWTGCAPSGDGTNWVLWCRSDGGFGALARPLEWTTTRSVAFRYVDAESWNGQGCDAKVIENRHIAGPNNAPFFGYDVWNYTVGGTKWISLLQNGHMVFNDTTTTGKTVCSAFPPN
jgi:hypothetical protein